MSPGDLSADPTCATWAARRPTMTRCRALPGRPADARVPLRRRRPRPSRLCLHQARSPPTAIGQPGSARLRVLRPSATPSDRSGARGPTTHRTSRTRRHRTLRSAARRRTTCATSTPTSRSSASVRAATELRTKRTS
jgi:hypothetical protein